MDRLPVSSSNLVSVGYDPATQTLEVEFVGKPSNSVYQYDGVPQEAYDSLMAAESKGARLHSAIKGKFPHRKV